jgi:hypothetical protein
MRNLTMTPAEGAGHPRRTQPYKICVVDTPGCNAQVLEGGSKILKRILNLLDGEMCAYPGAPGSANALANAAL